MGKFDTIIQEINTNIADNNTQSITAKKLRDTLIDLTDTIVDVQDSFESDVDAEVSELGEEIMVYETNINNRVNGFETSINNEIDRFETSVNGQIGDMNEEITGFETSINDQISDINDEIDDIREDITTYYLNDEEANYAGKIVGSDGSLVNATTAQALTKEYVIQQDVDYYANLYTTSTSSTSWPIAYYNGNTFISGEHPVYGSGGSGPISRYKLTIPGNATKVRVFGNITMEANLYNATSISDKIENINNEIDEISNSVSDLNNAKMDKSYTIYEASPLTATDTQYQTGYYIYYNGDIFAVSGFGVLGFDCTENQELLITGSFGNGPSCLGVFQDDNGNNKGLVLQKPNNSPYNNTVVSDYYCQVPSGATKIYVQTNKNLLQNLSCKLVVNTTYRQYSEDILQNETDIDSIQADLEQLRDDFDELIYTELTIPQTWVNKQTYTLNVGEAPSINTNISQYVSLYIQNLQVGDSIFVKARSGSSWKFGAKVKNGVVVSLITNPSSTPVALEGMTFTVDDSFDAIVFNNYTGYIVTPLAELITKVSRISVIEDNITDLQETVNDIIEQGVGGEFNLLCFGNSFTQDTISYIPWLIKECEPNIKLNVYFTYMGGMPISECLAYISNGTVIALNSEGNPSTKYENHGGWDRIYSYSNGEWVEPASDTTNYHKSYTLYKYEDGANSWVSQSEPTAASVLQMKNWDLITIQQAGSYNYDEWNYYFKPYVYQIQAELQKQVKHNFTLGYLMTHASYSTSSETLLRHYNGIVQNTTKMLENTPVEIVMPYATALQNARTTYLDRFGAGGHLMGDTAHVSDGVGCLICAYANTMAILDLIGSKKSIVGSQIYPDAAWLSSHNIPAVSSTIEGLSRYNIWLAQQCAVMATKYPLQLTNIVEKGMCGDIEIEIVNDTVYSSNPILSANNGDSWITTLIAPDGTTINSVSVVMGTTDITSSVYDSTTKEINIPNVSAKVTITAQVS